MTFLKSITALSLLVGTILTVASLPALAEEPLAMQVHELERQFATGDTKMACKGFKQLAKQDPALVEAHYGMAMCARSDGHRDDAIEHLETVLSLSPNHAPAHLLLAELQDEAGNVEAANVHYRQYGYLLKTTGLGAPKSPKIRLRLRQLNAY